MCIAVHVGGLVKWMGEIMAKQQIFVVCNEQTQGKKIEILLYNGQYSVIIDGVTLSKVGKNVFEYTTTEGSTVTATLQGNALTGLTISMQGKSIEVVRKLAWYEWVIAILTIAPCIYYGAVGGFIGALFMCLSIVTMRKIDNVVGRVLAGIGVAVGAFCCAYVVALIIGAIFVSLGLLTV